MTGMVYTAGVRADHEAATIALRRLRSMYVARRRHVDQGQSLEAGRVSLLMQDELDKLTRRQLEAALLTAVTQLEGLPS